MPLLNTGFKNIKREIKEFRAVPPENSFKVVRYENKITVNDENNPQHFTNGDYQANSSSETIWSPWHSAINVFDDNRKSFWHTPWACCGHKYRQGPYDHGKYIGGGKREQYYTTTTTSGEKLHGEWLEITLPYELRITRYEILTSLHCCPMRFPTRFKVLGSNDNTNWVVLDKQNIDGDPRNKYDLLKPVPFEINNGDKNMYKTFRFVFEGSMHHGANNVMNITSVNIYGAYPCFNVAGQCENIQTYSNRMPKLEGFSIVDNETKLLADLKEFNQLYTRYVTCNDQQLNGVNNKMGCSKDEMSNQAIDKVNDAYNNIIVKNDKNELIGGSLYALYNTDLNQYKSDTEYDASLNVIKTNHKDIVSMRNELDEKLKELHVTEGSLAYEQKRIFDGTAYTGLIWTILATSTLFYVFKRL